MVNKWLEDYGIDYVMGYASHDKYCTYFQKTFPNYLGKVIPVAFGFGDRFHPTVPFDDRRNKCVALGAVSHLRPLNYPKHNYQEYADFYPDESWLHKFRRLVVLNEERLGSCLDSRLPGFPRMKDFSYDLVALFNEYRMFVSCETIFYFPPAKYYEGPACGTVLVCSDHACNRDVGFMGGENCITYRLHDIDDLEDKIRYYQKNSEELSSIQERGTEFVRSHYSHRQVAKDLVGKIEAVAGSVRVGED
jgi:glycosyltransferase involved in cell wall biosynthesis